MQGIQSHRGFDSVLNRVAAGGQNQILKTLEGPGQQGVTVTVVPPRTGVPRLIGMIIDAARRALSLDKPEVEALAQFRQHLVEKFGQEGANVAASLRGRHITVGDAQAAMTLADAQSQRRVQAFEAALNGYLDTSHGMVNPGSQERSTLTLSNSLKQVSRHFIGDLRACKDPQGIEQLAQRTAQFLVELQGFQDGIEFSAGHKDSLNQRFKELFSLKHIAATVPAKADSIETGVAQFFTRNQDTGALRISQALSRNASSSDFGVSGQASTPTLATGSDKSHDNQALHQQVLKETNDNRQALAELMAARSPRAYDSVVQGSMIKNDISREVVYKVNGHQLLIEKDADGNTNCAKFANDLRTSLPPGKAGDDLFVIFCSLCHQDTLSIVNTALTKATNLFLVPESNMEKIDPIAFEVNQHADGSWNFQCATLRHLVQATDFNGEAVIPERLESPGDMLETIDCRVRFDQGNAYISSIATDLIVHRPD